MSKGIAIATLIGTIIGAGILGIPYVFVKAGLIPGLINVIGIGLFFILLNLYMGEITLRTKGNHQLTGYAEIYLGKTGKIVLTIAMIIEIYGALIAYTIGEGTSFASLFGGNPALYGLIFFFIGSYLIFRGLKTIGKTEFVLVLVLAVVVILVSIFSLPHVNPSFFEGGDGNLLGPYGVVLFAYFGVTAIPLLKEILSKERKKIKAAIFWGSVIPIFVYTFFALVVVGVIGIEGFAQLATDQRIASAALNTILGGPIGFFINIFAILAMGTSFLALGIVLREVFEYDYKIHKNKALLLTLIIPLAIFLWDAFVSDIANFILILGITGAISGGITNNLIILIFHRAKKLGKRKPEFTIKSNIVLSSILFILLTIGIIYGMLQLI